MRIGGIARRWGVGCLAVATVGGVADLASAQPLRRDLSAYFAFAQRSLSLKDFTLNDRCNVGVNCAQPNPNASCGVLGMDEALFADGSQIAGDIVRFNKSGADVFQVFRNGGPPLAGVTVRQPPVQSFTTPIIPGTCGPGCTPVASALEEQCGFPNPFPSCGAGTIVVQPGQDCTGDTAVGNGICDLPPGTYGSLDVRNGAKVRLGIGDYVFCSVKMGKNVDVLAAGARFLIPPGADPAFRVNNSSRVGQQCGDVTVLLKGEGVVALGKHSEIAARICAPQSLIQLGHDNQLVGQFVGDTIAADFKNEGRCCGACTCFDSFSPMTAAVNAVVTLASGCDLTNATAVRVCGMQATIVSKTVHELKFRVPAGAAGACVVEVDSVPGAFTGSMKLTVM